MKLLQNEVTEKDAYSDCVYNNKGGDTKNQVPFLPNKYKDILLK